MVTLEITSGVVYRGKLLEGSSPSHMAITWLFKDNADTFAQLRIT